MTVVAGGSKMNLVTGYSEPENAQVNYGKHKWIAQTFTLEAEYILWRCRFKSWTAIGDRFYEYGLRDTDVDGKPLAVDLFWTSRSPTGESYFPPGKWRIFQFNEFPRLSAGVYALVARVVDATRTSDYKLRCDADAAAYAGGKAWESDDNGLTWTEIPGTDLMFEVWGYQTPPEPPPPPVISNWAPVTISEVVLETGVRVVVTTDIPVHLFMRWTEKPPLKHPTTEYRRGLLIQTGTRYCFVAWDENEQEEPGDTLVHTFIKPGWYVCQTRYFYFIGTKQCEEQPSSSPIFHYHNEGVTSYKTFNLEVTGDGVSTGIRFPPPEDDPKHWQLVLQEDTVWNPETGPWGEFVGNYVYEKYYYYDPFSRDYYQLQQPPFFTQEVMKVITHARLGRSTYPYGKYAFYVYPGYPGHFSPKFALAPGLAYYSYEWPLNPNTGLAWTLEDIKTLQAGIGLGEGASFGWEICDHFWVEVQF